MAFENDNFRCANRIYSGRNLISSETVHTEFVFCVAEVVAVVEHVVSSGFLEVCKISGDVLTSTQCLWES